jgi:two-component system, OmpR family, KDP operon response regulator KdpE
VVLTGAQQGNLVIAPADRERVFERFYRAPKRTTCRQRHRVGSFDREEDCGGSPRQRVGRRRKELRHIVLHRPPQRGAGKSRTMASHHWKRSGHRRRPGSAPRAANDLDALGFDGGRVCQWRGGCPEVDCQRFDAVLMDVNMPGMGGIEACRRIREDIPQLQILMLTVRDGEADKIEALDAGADDYITKPFSIPELAARLRSAVRRSATTARLAQCPIVIGDIELDPDRRTLRKSGPLLAADAQRVRLAALPDAPSGPARGPRQGSAGGVGRRVRPGTGILAHLRSSVAKETGGRSGAPEYLLTEPHFGYRFREPSESAAGAKA